MELCGGVSMIGGVSAERPGQHCQCPGPNAMLLPKVMKHFVSNNFRPLKVMPTGATGVTLAPGVLCRQVRC